MFIINEDKRTQLVADSKRGKRERDGLTRYQKRLKSKVANSVKEFNRIDMNELFKNNIITISINVRGETDNYLVKISYGGFLDALKDELRRTGKEIIDLRLIIRALIIAFNKEDVYISCSCLHPDTKIKLLDGSSPTVAEMKTRFDKGETLYVYSVDEKGDFKPGKVEKVWITKTTKDFIKITLDNNQEILTTPDHLYMLRDGSYEQAQNLKVNQSLMPLYTKLNDKGYELIKRNSSKCYYSTYKEVANYYYKDLINETNLKAESEKYLNKMPYNVAIHHTDFNKLNNNPENLQIMTGYEHWMYHANLMSQKWQNTDFRNKTIESLKSPEFSYKMKHRFDNWTADDYNDMVKRRNQSNIGKHFGKQSPETCALKSKNRKGISPGKHNLEWNNNISQGIKNLYSNYTQEQWNKKIEIAKNTFNRPDVIEKRKQGINNYWNNLSENDKNYRINALNECRKNSKYVYGPKPENSKLKMSASHLNMSESTLWNYNKKSLTTRWMKRINKLLSQGIIVNEDTFINSFDITSRKNTKEKLYKYFNGFDYFLNIINNNYNHKIIKVEKITLEDTPVYDIKVKDYHNFLTDAGVILHNCSDFFYRFGYWATVNNINSGEPQLIPSDETNPNNDLGPGCKHVMLVLSNTSWLIKVASVINNYIKYMLKYREKQYADIIYPAIYGKKYEKPVQQNIFDDEMETDTETIDKSNEEGRVSGRFSSENQPSRNPSIRKAQERKNKSPEEEEVNN